MKRKHFPHLHIKTTLIWAQIAFFHDSKRLYQEMKLSWEFPPGVLLKQMWCQQFDRVFASKTQCSTFVAHSFVHVTLNYFLSLILTQVAKQHAFHSHHCLKVWQLMYFIWNFSSFSHQAVFFCFSFMDDSLNSVYVLLLVALHCDKSILLFLFHFFLIRFLSFFPQRNRSMLSFVSKFMQLFRANIENQSEVSTWIVISAGRTSSHWVIQYERLR